MDGICSRHILAGFLADAIATVTTHEITNFLLLQAGVFPRVPWSAAPAAVTGVPQIASDRFLGRGMGRHVHSRPRVGPRSEPRH